VEVEFLDSAGLGVLVGGLKRVRAHDGSLDLVCTQERILKIFRITGRGPRPASSGGRRLRRLSRSAGVGEGRVICTVVPALGGLCSVMWPPAGS